MTVFFPEVDLILLERFKDSSWPKLEVARSENSVEAVCPPGTLLALVTDLTLEIPGVPVLFPDNAAEAAELILRCVKG